MFAQSKGHSHHQNQNKQSKVAASNSVAASNGTSPGESKMDELREAFAFFDQNGNGSIEAEELGAVMRSLGYHATDSELRDMIHEADVDGNDKIDFDEFVRMMETKSRQDQAEDEELREAFKVFDRDGNGFISRAELSHVMRNIGENLTDDDINEMINEADKNGDGQIDYEEFVCMLAKNEAPGSDAKGAVFAKSG